MKKYLSYILVMAAVVVVGLGGYGIYVYQEFQESEQLAEETQSRIVDPIIEDEVTVVTASERDAQMQNNESDVQTDSGDSTSSSQTAPAVEPALPVVTKSFVGDWTSHRDYISTGSVTVKEVDGDYIIQFSNDYTFSGAPDPFIYLAGDSSQTLNNALLLGKLQSNSGAQAYSVSAEEFEQYGVEVYIWCRAFNLFMGSATLQQV